MDSMDTGCTLLAMSVLDLVRCHPLKTDPDPFEAVFCGKKTAEFRKNDRDFHVGDELDLREILDTGKLTGRTVIAHVTHVQNGYGIPNGYVMLSLKVRRLYFSPNDSLDV